MMSMLALLYMASTPFLAKRYSEKGRYYAWLIIIIGLIIPFRPQWSNPIVTMDVPNSAVVPITQTWGDNIAIMPPIMLSENTISIATTFNITLWHGIAVVWLIGMITFVVCQIIRHYRFVKTARRWSEAITDEKTLSLFHELRTEMGIENQIGLSLCPCVGSPMMIGLVKPQILLPISGLAQDELRFIFKHEFVHYKRKDLLYKSLVLIATAIHWFNPIVHLMAREINILCETSCDAEVVRNTNEGTRQQYSETIIGVVKYRSKIQLATALSTNFYGGKKGMRSRISSIMDMTKKRAGVFVLCCVLMLTLGTGIVVAENTPPTWNGLTAHAYTVEETAFIVWATNGQTFQSFDNGLTWQPSGTNFDSDFIFDEITIEEVEQELEALKYLADALVASGDFTREEINANIANLEKQIEQVRNGDLIISRPFEVDGNVASIAISPSLQSEDATIVHNIFEANTFVVTDDYDSINRLSVAEIFAEYGEWGLTIEGLYPDPDGGLIANSRQNVFFQGQLVRGLSDFGDGVSMSISSADRGGSEWVSVVRDNNGRIIRLDLE